MASETFINLSSAYRFIADGADSQVFCSGNDVLKVYRNFRQPLEVFQKYAEVTNRAAELLKTTPCTVKVSSSEAKGDPIEGYYEIVPVTQVGLTKGGIPVIVSPYIQGPNLEDVFCRYGDIQDKIMEVDTKEQARLREAVDLLYTGVQRQSLSKCLIPDLNVLTYNLRVLLGTKGVNIEFMNVKMRWNMETQRLRLAITDLSGGVNPLLPDTI